ncbi:MAG: AAA family ATPase [Actinomycetota bacterium]|nr:AAA family ATPase [Actinomycetota bacterium]
MDFRLLGPVEVREGDRIVAVGGARQRALLAILLLHANEVMPAEQLVHDLWELHPPETAVNTLQAHVSRLRKALGKSRIVTRSPGYLLTLEEGERDIERFDSLVEQGRQALASGNPANASRLLDEALMLWRGPPLADLSVERFAQPAIRRLEEARLAALEDRIEADLAAGLHATVIPELESLIAQHPLRERLRAQLMLALYRSGRQAEALEIYRATRRVLVDELGIEPSPFLQRLEAAILLQDSSLEVAPSPRSAAVSITTAIQRPLLPFDATPPGLENPIVGRDVELAQLRQAYNAAKTRRACHLATVLGPPGIGKSRLAQELLTQLRADALTLVGRCLPQGEGVAFGPLIEIVKQVAGDTTVDALKRLLEHEEQGELVAERLAGAFGSGGNAGELEDTFWAARKLLEALAANRPLVVALEDVHSADRTFLDFVEYVVDWSQSASIFLVCLARPELLDSRPSWSGGKVNVSSLALDALTQAESFLLIESLTTASPLAAADRERVAAVAEGNPLFIEQMLALTRENEGEDLRVPATIHAILAARIDRLGSEERDVLERAAVIGREFWLGALRDLAGARSNQSLLPVLRRLVRKDLIRPDRSVIPGEEAFRFRHALIRDVVYKAVPQALRAQLHERFANWLEWRLANRLNEVDETIGHHLERAYRCRTKSGLGDDAPRDLAARAARHLAAAQHRELGEAGIPARIERLMRAAQLLDDNDRLKGDIYANLASDYEELCDWERAGECYEEAFVIAEAVSDVGLATYVRIRQLRCQLRMEPTRPLRDFMREGRRALPRLEATSENYGITVRAFLASARLSLGNAGVAEEYLRSVLNYATRERNGRLLNMSRRILLGAWLWGPRHACEAIQLCQAVLRDDPPLRVAASASRSLAVLTAMRGEFDEARGYVERDHEILEHLGLAPTAAGMRTLHASVELLAGRPSEAERILRPAMEALSDVADTWFIGGVAAVLAQALYAQGRYDEAWELTAVPDRIAERDVASPIRAWGTQAKVLARRGASTRAKDTVWRAVRLALRTDAINDQADAFMDLAEVLKALDEPQVAYDAAGAAIRLYERKGNIVSAQRARGAAGSGLLND